MQQKVEIMTFCCIYHFYYKAKKVVQFVFLVRAAQL